MVAFALVAVSVVVVLAFQIDAADPVASVVAGGAVDGVVVVVAVVVVVPRTTEAVKVEAW